MECRGFESHPRQLRKVTALGVLCCFALFVCLTLPASFFLPSHLSFKNMYICTYTYYILGLYRVQSLVTVLRAQEAKMECNYDE